MAEDIIHYAGLIENVNYLKQSVNAAATKPDFTFLLPQGHCINMDVKSLWIITSDGQRPEGVQRDSLRRNSLKTSKTALKRSRTVIILIRRKTHWILFCFYPQ